MVLFDNVSTSINKNVYIYIYPSTSNEKFFQYRAPARKQEWKTFFLRNEGIWIFLYSFFTWPGNIHIQWRDTGRLYSNADWKGTILYLVSEEKGKNVECWLEKNKDTPSCCPLASSSLLPAAFDHANISIWCVNELWHSSCQKSFNIIAKDFLHSFCNPVLYVENLRKQSWWY